MARHGAGWLRHGLSSMDSVPGRKHTRGVIHSGVMGLSITFL